MAGEDDASGDVFQPELAALLPEIEFEALTAAATTVLKTTVDASIYADSPNTNRGGNTRLWVDGAPRIRSLLRFDLSSIPQGSLIRSARLRLLVTDGSGDAGGVYRVSGSWSEGAVTWNNAPSVGSRVSTIGAVSAGTWKTVDVTAAAAAGAPLNLYLISSVANGAQYTSSESTNAPQLVVEWEAGAPISAPSTGCTAIPSSRLGLLTERAGFGRSVTGGASGCLYTVTNANDDGPGSLRWAAERGGYWIIFAGDYTIRLNGEIEVAGNTTIDGRGRRVAIERGGLYIRSADSSNVILTNLTVRNSPSGEDLIQVRNGATGFWLHHLTLLDSSDEFIDVGSPPSTGLRGTISWTRFDRTDGYELVFIMGDNNNIQNNDEIRVTVHHSFYTGTNSRHPLITGAKLHTYNNVYQWIRWGIQIQKVTSPRKSSRRETSSTRVTHCSRNRGSTSRAGRTMSAWSGRST